MNKQSRKPVKEIERGAKVILPSGLYPINKRIYVQKVTPAESLTRAGLQVVTGEGDIGKYEYIVVACDPSIMYKIHDAPSVTDESEETLFPTWKEVQLKPGDIVRPFVIPNAPGYTPVIDTYCGVTYIIFEQMEIASIVPTAQENITIN